MQELTLMTFGLLYGLPPEADTVIGTRGLPNPYYIPALREKTGLDREVRDYVFSTPESEAYYQSVLTMVRRRAELYDGYDSPLKVPLVIAVGCTGGHHRSVSVAHALAEFIGRKGYRVEELHRDISRQGHL